MIEGRFAFGVVGGLGALAGADMLGHLIRATAADHERYAVSFEQQSFPGDRRPADAAYDPTGRKLHAFGLIRRLEARGADAILLPCFVSHTFLDELVPNVNVPIVGLMAALRAEVLERHPGTRRIGVLTSTYVRDRALFDRTFGDVAEVLYPDDAGQAALMEAVYGDDGLKAGHGGETAAALLKPVCDALVARGCDIVLPGFTELSLVGAALGPALAVPFPDANRCYADHAVARPSPRPPQPFRIGVVGGVGPLATVDFMGKVVALTEARRDQDHVRLIVEQNPQIPDRTEHLLAGGPDPTVALFATCKRLEAAGADLIVIPCNTAHAFVGRLQPHLGIPILDMLDETMARAAALHPGRLVGLLATSGTVESGVYAAAAERAGVPLIVPDAVHQERVMEAVYGAHGVKAGFTAGRCRDDIAAAIAHLARRGAGVVVLGCTELPLILPRTASFAVDGEDVALLDPTMLLAGACVRRARA